MATDQGAHSRPTTGSRTIESMHALLSPHSEAQVGRLATVIEIVLPVYNEQRVLESSVRRLRSYLDQFIPFASVVTIADNASTDGTWPIASQLAESIPGVRATRLDQKGRGRALRSTWMASDAQVVAYMDIDLSTDLGALLPLVAPLISGHSDVAIGTRLAAGSRVVRGPKRELISRTYNLMVKATLRSRFSDAQCGFKALRREAAVSLLPLIEDNEWFFDTELLLLAERNGLRIHEVPVDWVDDADSRVHIASTAKNDIVGLARMARGFAAGRGRAPEAAPIDDVDEVSRFAGVGVASTAAYLVLFALLRRGLGASGANLVALGLCTMANTVAHARFTFGARGPFRVRDQAIGAAVVFLTCAALTSVGLLLVGLWPAASLGADLVAVTIGTAIAALIRFIGLRAWSFRSHTRTRHRLKSPSTPRSTQS
jgi:putative flippase GtrA